MQASPIVLAVCAVAGALAGPALAAPREGTAYHLYRTPAQLARMTPGARPQAATAGTTMEYFGGPVIANVKVEVVIWGGNVAPATVQKIGPFLGAMANGTYTDQLAQYSTNLVGVNGHPGTNQTIQRGSLLGQVTITPHNTATTVSDLAIRRELRYQVGIGALPKQDANTLYMIYFPANITITLGGSRSCVSFGAYHEAGYSTVTPGNGFYGVMPDCGGGFSNLTVVTSHEFAEAVSDAIPTPGSHPAYPQAWNNAQGYEIGDLCEGTNATLTAGDTVYDVQEVFDNATNACATGNFTSP